VLLLLLLLLLFMREVVTGGTFMVIYSGSSKKESINATEALRSRVGRDIIGEEEEEELDGGGGGALKNGTDKVVKSPLLPPRPSPAMFHSPRMRKRSSDNISNNGSNGTVPTAAAKVIWEID
jgi:hypothetical protein